ncbi:MAG: NAD(P)-dependent oxidoreductase [Candidatus Poribacteria bacterium]|nr:MAG: NAD(P)-dependent oxidoreductase [Candidatus Poribacteria bacterium]
MIGVTGSTGNLGRLVVAALLRRGVPANRVVALARDLKKAAGLAAQGVIVRQADYTQPETLERALVGVERLLLISANEIGKRVEQHRNVIQAARRVGVGGLVYTSLLHADRSELSLADEHRQTEVLIQESGLGFTLLRNGWYTENYESNVRAALAHGVLVGSAGEGRISSAARADYAEAAAAVLTTEGHTGKTYELAGDESWTMSDLARTLSRLTGREIPYRNLSPEEYAAVLAQSGLPEPVAQMIAEWDRAIARGALFDESRQLSHLIGRPTTPMEQTVAQWVHA